MSNDPQSPCRCDSADEHDTGGCDYTHIAYSEIVAERRRIEGS